jgi:hypothetical protein
MATTPDLIVENGTIVAGADSFVTQAEYAAYAALLGINVDGVENQKYALIKAAAFLGSFEGRLKGSRVSRDQLLCFPRSGVVIDGFEWNDNEIPRNVKLAQMQFALDLQAGIDIYNPPQSDSVAVRREKVEGAVEVEYAVADSMKLSRYSSSRALLNSLLVNSGLTLVLERA